jgi:glutathionylspermidine synthase
MIKCVEVISYFPHIPVLFFSAKLHFLMHTYSQLADQLIATRVLTDPWLDGKPRFSLSPIIISSLLYQELCAVAEAMAQVHDSLCDLLLTEPDFMQKWYGLLPYQQALWNASGGAWHGIARIDAFVCEDGRIQVCEMNSDTPSGEPEAVLLNQTLALMMANNHTLHDPNAMMEERFCTMIWKSYIGTVNETLHTQTPRIAIVYPTEITEDMPMIALYQQWFRKRGWHCVLGSPFNLHAMPQEHTPHRIGMFGECIDIVIRHYKTDWWAERQSPWCDEMPLPDSAPLHREITLLCMAEYHGAVCIINPFGAVLTQNKLSMALLWHWIERFTPHEQAMIRTYLPRTYRLIDLQTASIIHPEFHLNLADKDRWVLKSDYGCEGDDVIIGKSVSQEIWELSLAMAIPERWIIQEYFSVKKIIQTPENGSSHTGIAQSVEPNYGVYIIGGSAREMYMRLSPTATDGSALSAGVFVSPATENNFS